MSLYCLKHQASIKSQLRAHKLKITPARLEILDILEHATKPLSLEQICVLLKSSRADFATVYRNVESLKNLNLVREVSLNKAQSYYELAHKPHHHHLICQNCGVVKDVAHCANPRVSLAQLKHSGFVKINYHSLEFFGICNKCKI